MAACLSCDNHGMSNWGRWIRVLAAVVTALALLLAGWSARDPVASAHGDWATTISTLAAWTGDAGKIALGALIGAVGAWIVARMNRSQAREARFADQTRELCVEVIAEALVCMSDLRRHVAARSVGAVTDPSALPDYRNTALMRSALLRLAMVANRFEVVRAGRRLMTALENLQARYGWASWHESGVPDLTFSNEDWLAFQHEAAEVDALAAAFINAVRTEHGRQPLSDADAISWYPHPALRRPDQDRPPISRPESTSQH
jgi:hypothetical protein